MGDMETLMRRLTKGWSPLMTNSAGTHLVPHKNLLQSCTDCNTYEKRGLIFESIFVVNMRLIFQSVFNFCETLSINLAK